MPPTPSPGPQELACCSPACWSRPDQRPSWPRSLGPHGRRSQCERRTVSSATRSPNTTRAVPVASSACKTAVDRANTMLAIAVELQRTLAERDKLLSDAANGGPSSREVRERGASVLKAGTSGSARFNQALADYRRVVDQCKLHAP